MLAHDFMPFPGETQYIGYIRANYSREFPKLIDQSQYNRRAQLPGARVELLRREWLGQLGMLTTLDGMPIVYDLMAASTDERAAAEVVLQRVKNCDIFADKGFIGDEWHTAITSGRPNAPTKLFKIQLNLTGCWAASANALRPRFIVFKTPVGISNAS